MPTASTPTTGPDGRFILSRPFHFTTVVWGERFRNYFLEYCLPSLLSPRNIPVLSTEMPSKFLIATLPEDWAAMKATPIFKLMERYVTPVFLEIPPCPVGRSGCEHMGIGHKLACERSFQEKAYTVILTPDSMFTDGTVARAQELAATGTVLVLGGALRFGEELFLPNLERMGLLPRVSRRDNAIPLTITGREMTKAAINGFHSEVLTYEWDAPYFHPKPSAAWWPVPGEDGIVLHPLSWAPLMADYGALKAHDSSTLDDWTLDGDYIYKNFGNSPDVHVVQDSDDMFYASWGPLDDRPQSLEGGALRNFPRIAEWLKGIQFRDVFLSGFYDPLKQRLFFKTVRWHANPLNDKWGAVEKQALRTIRRYVRPEGEEFYSSNAKSSFARKLAGWRYSLWSAGVTALAVPLRFTRLIDELWQNRERGRQRIRDAWSGDREARVRLFRRLVLSFYKILGREEQGLRTSVPRSQQQ